MGILLDNKHLECVKSAGKLFVEIPSLSVYPELVQGFTTRFGGVSTGDYSSLNLNFNKPDPRSNVVRNYAILGAELGVPLNRMVLSHQVHSVNVMPVTVNHAGMGITRERSYSEIDGLATQETDLLLITHYADCVPLYFYDSVKNVIALSHSGWKGTLHNIAGETINLLHDVYGCSPDNIRVAFGPHIKDCCFEVGDDVAQLFAEAYPWMEEFSNSRPDGKRVLDLEGIIARNLVQLGVSEYNISGCRVCTRCNKDMFFSHRGGNGRTGTGAAFMMIRGKA